MTTALRLILSVLALALFTGVAGAQNAPPGAASRHDVLAKVKSWGYQLQKADPDVIAASPYDLVVIDYSRSGDDEGRFTPDEVRRMQVKPDGSRRLVLAYLSVGEAEGYRYYWTDDWVETLKVVVEGDIADEEARNIATAKRPGAQKIKTLRFPRLSAPVWLGRENASWTGNFFVRYWEKSWQDIIFGGNEGYLERIVAAGFDGAFLDRVDAFYGVTDERTEGRADMVRLVTALAARARALNPRFVILPQNGEELLAESAYLAAIDGIAKEDLLYGNPTEGQPNPAATIATTTERLMPARRAGHLVLVTEYVLEKDVADRIRAELAPNGFVPYFGPRTLDRLVLPGDLRVGPVRPAGGKGAAAAPGRGRAPKR